MQHFFEKAGPGNTARALQILQQGIAEHGVKQVVVASTHGDTGLAAQADRAQFHPQGDAGINIITVYHIKFLGGK